MRKGKGGLMAAMVGIPLLAILVIGGLVVMSEGDEPYRTLGRNINGLRQERFDPFWGCVLDGVEIDNIDSNTVLAREIHQRAGSGRRAAWAAHVRDDCMPDLTELELRLSVLIPPEELTSQVHELEGATSDLRSAWSGYVAYVEGLDEEPYDRERAGAHVTAIARAWYDYRRVHGALNSAIRERLEGG